MDDRAGLARGQARARPSFDTAELGALAHLYRGEVYRSTIWRTRLDQTTNWAVVTTGLAMSLTFSGPYASPLPLILVGLLVIVFLLLESRRYRYFNVWRARCRLMETDVYGPMLRGEGVDARRQVEHAARRATTRGRASTSATCGRSAGGCGANYAYILAIQAIAYYGKLAIHPMPAEHLATFLAARGGRAAARAGGGAGRAGLPRHLDRRWRW